MGRIKGYYEWDDDGLTPGRKKEGGLHQNLFDNEGNLKGSARFVPDEGEPDRVVVTENVYMTVEMRRRSREDEELEETIDEAIELLIEMGIDFLRPRVERYWRETVRPVLDGRLARVRERFSRRRTQRAAEVLETIVVEPSEALADERPRMSRAEAQARYLAGVAAQAFSDEQFRLVAQADIVEGEDLEQLRLSLLDLPSDQVKELIEAMVRDPSLLGEAHLAELASVLGRRELLAQPRRAPR